MRFRIQIQLVYAWIEQTPNSSGRSVGILLAPNQTPLLACGDPFPQIFPKNLIEQAEPEHYHPYRSVQNITIIGSKPTPHIYTIRFFFSFPFLSGQVKRKNNWLSKLRKKKFIFCTSQEHYIHLPSSPLEISHSGLARRSEHQGLIEERNGIGA